MFFFRLLYLALFISTSFSNSNNSCVLNDFPQHQFRTEYSIGDTLTMDDQNALYSVCNGADGYETGDFFSFADMNGDLNGGDYKITLISMNATW